MLSYPNWLRKYQESDEVLEALEEGYSLYSLYSLYKERLAEELFYDE